MQVYDFNQYANLYNSKEKYPQSCNTMQAESALKIVTPDGLILFYIPLRIH